MVRNILINVIFLCSLYCIKAQIALPTFNLSIVEDIIKRNTINLHEITNQIEGFKNLFGIALDTTLVPPDVDAIAKMTPVGFCNILKNKRFHNILVPCLRTTETGGQILGF